eukprot:12501_1
MRRLDIAKAKRGCTDVFFLLLLLATTAAVGYAVYWCMTSAPSGLDLSGGPGAGLRGISLRRAILGADFENNVCGESEAQKDRRMYFIPTVLDVIDVKEKSVKIKTPDFGKLLGSAQFRVCVADCADTFAILKKPDSGGELSSPESVDSGYKIQFLRNTSSSFGEGAVGYPTKAVADHICFPDFARMRKLVSRKSKLKSFLDISGIRKFLTDLVDMLYKANYTELLANSDFTIVYKFGIPIILVVIVIYIMVFLRHFSGFFVWLIFLLIFVLMAGVAAYLVLFSEDLFAIEAKKVKIAGYVIGGLATVYLLLLIALR